MARSAREQGYQYIAMADHTKNMTICDRLNARQKVGRLRQTDRLNEKLDDIVVLKTAERELCEVDLERVLRATRDTGCFPEVNAQTNRLDLNDKGCRLAKKLKVKMATSMDAHSTSGLQLMRFGVDQAPQ